MRRTRQSPRRRRSRLRPGDLLTEALAGILQRPGRTVLTLVGIVLGIGSFVAVLGLTTTATSQISQRFTRLAATEVTVEDVTTEDTALTTAFPEDSESRALHINGTSSAGVFWTVSARQVGTVTGVPLPGAQTSGDQIPVVATTPGLLNAVHGHLAWGRTIDGIMNQRAERVVVLGKSVATRLGVTRTDIQQVIFINEAPFVVLGVVDAVERRPDLLAAVWVPRRTAETLWPGRPDPSQPAKMIIDTRLGAAAMVAKQVALALRPDAVTSFRVVPPPDPRQLKDDINTDLAGLFLVLAAICLIVGAVGIANTTLVAVLERVDEIGLRRALGAGQRHIAGQFLCESSVLGTIGGLLAAGVGVAVVVAVSAIRQWTPTVEPWTVLAVPLVGCLTGLLSGAYPAIRASRIQPAEALRQ